MKIISATGPRRERLRKELSPFSLFNSNGGGGGAGVEARYKIKRYTRSYGPSHPKAAIVWSN